MQRSDDAQGKGPEEELREVRRPVLTALADGPRDAEEVVAAIAELNQGLHVPKLERIETRLQQLEANGLVESRQSEGRRLYGLSEQGRAALSGERSPGRPTPPTPEGGMDPRVIARELGAAASNLERSASPRKADAAREILEDARRRLEELAGDV